MRTETDELYRAGRGLTRREAIGRSAAALAAAGSGVLLTACGGTPAAGTPVTFLAVVPFTTLTFAPEMLADAAGYFADQGLTPDFQSTRGSPQAIQLVIAGSAPISRIGQIEAVSHVVTRGAPLMNVATVIKKTTIRIISSTAAPLREPRDFAGKTLGIPSQGGESETTLDLLLASSGIEPAAVTRQIVGVGPGVFNLVQQGRVAGFIVSLDTAKILERQMEGVVVLDPGDFIQSGAQVYMVSADGLERNRDIVRRYLEAVYAAIDFMIDDDGFDETLRIMRQKYSFATLEDDAVAKASLEDYRAAWTAEGRHNVLRTVPESWRRGYEELVQAGRVESGRDPSEWFTNDLVPTSRNA
jgi:NitT/TauT family transport system substrate-binding protein